MTGQRITKPQWPAYLMAGFAAACAYPAITMPPPAAETYRAVGQDSGWSLAIADGRIDFVDEKGETRIAETRPEPSPTATGRRYETERLTVDIVRARCIETASGQGYAHRVTVIADGAIVRGCGGERREDWDV